MFSCGRFTIYDTYSQIRDNFISTYNIPRMQVTYMNGAWWTYTGNRRLWVFRKLEAEGYIWEVDVDTTDRSIPRSKFTTRNNGTSVVVRGSHRAEIPSGGRSSGGARFDPPSRTNFGSWTHYYDEELRCSVCSRYFRNANDLAQHTKTHAPRTVACPVCGEVCFRSGTNAVQHVESGSCRGCRGKDNARNKIFEFVSNNRATQQFLALAIEDKPHHRGGPGDLPYRCSHCSKRFRQFSQLMQHETDKHGNGSRMALTY